MRILMLTLHQKVKWTKNRMAEISVKILTNHDSKRFDNWNNDRFKRNKIQLYRKRFNSVLTLS